MTDGKALSLATLLEDYYDALHDAYDAMRKAFKLRGFSQDELARKLDVDKGLISKRLNGQENLTLKTLSFMASAMGCKLGISYIPYENVQAIEIVVEAPKVTVLSVGQGMPNLVEASSTTPRPHPDIKPDVLIGAGASVSISDVRFAEAA